MVEAELRRLGVTRSGEEEATESAAPVIAADQDEADIMDGEPATKEPAGRDLCCVYGAPRALSRSRELYKFSGC